VEHNNLHHYRLGEVDDPDLVEENLASLRSAKLPVFVKYLGVLSFMLTWKWLYYAPNTYKTLKQAERKRKGKECVCTEQLTLYSLLSGEHPDWVSLKEFVLRVAGPYFVYRFILFPLPWLLIPAFFNIGNPLTLYWNAILNCMLADTFANVHSFIIVVTNHAGNDIYRFTTPCRPKSATFFLRQIVGSTDYPAGTDMVDFWHGWLNYQIEHHLWPNLSMLSYQRAMPEVKLLCAKYHIPYVQENVFWRLKKTADIAIGLENMRVFPLEWENIESK